MRILEHRGLGDQPIAERLLVIMLPGAYSKPEDFQTYGFVRTLHARYPQADVQAVDAHPGYFSDGSLVARLATDVITPAKKQGYQRIWLVGISLGGLGALSYVADRSSQASAKHGSKIDEEIESLLAIAPYPGSRDTWRPILKAGSLAAWQPTEHRKPDTSTGSSADADPELNLWTWLRDYQPTTRPKLVVGYGRDDRFADGQALISGALPPARVLVRDGGHDWPVWQAIWADVLKKRMLEQGDAD